MTQEAKKEEIGYAYNLMYDLGNGRQISITGNMPKGVTAADMSAEVDKLRTVFDRQQAKSAMRGVEDEIGQFTLRLNSAKEDLARIDEKGEAKNGLSAMERQQREAAVAHIDKMEKDLEYKQGVLQKLKDEAK